MYGQRLTREVLGAIKGGATTVNEVYENVVKTRSHGGENNTALKKRIRSSLKRLEAIGLISMERVQHPTRNNTYWKICLEKDSI